MSNDKPSPKSPALAKSSSKTPAFAKSSPKSPVPVTKMERNLYRFHGAVGDSGPACTAAFMMIFQQNTVFTIEQIRERVAKEQGTKPRFQRHWNPKDVKALVKCYRIRVAIYDGEKWLTYIDSRQKYEGHTILSMMLRLSYPDEFQLYLAPNLNSPPNFQQIDTHVFEFPSSFRDVSVAEKIPGAAQLPKGDLSTLHKNTSNALDFDPNPKKNNKHVPNMTIARTTKMGFDDSTPNAEWYLFWDLLDPCAEEEFEKTEHHPNPKITIYFEEKNYRFDLNKVSYNLSVLQHMKGTAYRMGSKMLIWRAISGIEILSCVYTLFIDFCYNLGPNSIEIYADLERDAKCDPRRTTQKIVLTKEYDSDAILEFQRQMIPLLMPLKTEKKIRVHDAILKSTAQADGTFSIWKIPFDPFFLDYLWIFDQAAKAVHDLDQFGLDE